MRPGARGHGDDRRRRRVSDQRPAGRAMHARAARARRQAVGHGLLEPESRALQLRAREGRQRQLRAQAPLSMAEQPTPPVEALPAGVAKKEWPWIELVKVLALPLVTLVLGYWFNASLNERQQIDNNVRLYAEMMGRREEADSNLRKDMFNSILTTFMARNPNSKLTDEEEIRQQILSLELLAYNFHESLDIGPLFKDVERRIPQSATGPDPELRRRLESVALQVIEHQLTALSDVGTVERGDALSAKIKDFQAHITFGMRTVTNPDVKPGEGTATLCMSMEATDRSRSGKWIRTSWSGSSISR